MSQPKLKRPTGRYDLEGADLDALEGALRELSASEILSWTWRTFRPAVAASSSFQTQSVPLLHMISRTAPEMPVFFLDTGFHFPETLAFRDRLEQELGLHVRNLRPRLGHDGFRSRHGELYRSDPDTCCFINKVEPLRDAMQGLRAWVTGIRRDQTTTRAAERVISLQPNGVYKICPLLEWTDRDVWRYLHEHGLPEHPLLAQGYLSVGCAPCTRPVSLGESPRAGRWAGTQKTECGIHVPEPPTA